MIEGTSLLVKKCTGHIAVSIHYDVIAVWI